MRSRVVTGFAAITLAACATLGPAPGTVVVGRGDPALDVEAVQRAVDQGGKVLLKGRFDFGEAGTVRLARDVEVLGEADAAGRPLTVIRGGRVPLRSLPPDAPAAGPRIAIRGIHFDGATWMAVHLAHASDTSVTGNVFTHVSPIAFPGGPISQGKPYNMQHGVVVGGVAVAPDQPLPYRPHAVTGRVTIEDNDFDLETAAPRTTLGTAIWLLRTTDVQADIARNKVRNAPRNGIEAIDNYRGVGGGGYVSIRENDIATPLDGIPIPGPRAPNGIMAGYFLDQSAAVDERRALPLRIIGNTVRARGQTASSVGVGVLADKALVSGNRIVLEGPGTIGILIAGSSNRAERNRVEGSGSFGIVLNPVGPLLAGHNELVDNDLSAVRASAANVALAKGAKGNRVAGSSGSVQDLGEGNVTQGLSPSAQAAR